VPGVERLGGQLAAGDDDREQVVEVVGDAAGEAPDGLELLGLAQLIFGAHQLVGAALDQRLELRAMHHRAA